MHGQDTTLKGGDWKMLTNEIFSKIRYALDEDRESRGEFDLYAEIDSPDFMHIKICDHRTMGAHGVDLEVVVKKRFCLDPNIDFANLFIKMFLEFGVSQFFLTIEEDYSTFEVNQSTRTKILRGIRSILGFNEGQLSTVTIDGLGLILDELVLENLDLKHLGVLEIINEAPNIVLGRNIVFDECGSLLFLFVNNWVDLINSINYKGGNNTNDSEFESGEYNELYNEMYIKAEVNTDDFKGIIPVERTVLNLRSNIPTKRMLKILDLQKCKELNLIYMNRETTQH